MVRTNIRDRIILFLCQDNACLSLIAEAIAKRLRHPETQIFSAGVIPGTVDARTTEALRERGMEVSSSSKSLNAIPVHDIDLAVAVGKLDGLEPVIFSRARWDRWPVSDPRQELDGAPESFRRTIDEIDTRGAGLFLDYWRNIV